MLTAQSQGFKILVLTNIPRSALAHTRGSLSTTKSLLCVFDECLVSEVHEFFDIVMRNVTNPKTRVAPKARVLQRGIDFAGEQLEQRCLSNPIVSSGRDFARVTLFNSATFVGSYPEYTFSIITKLLPGVMLMVQLGAVNFIRTTGSSLSI